MPTSLTRRGARLRVRSDGIDMNATPQFRLASKFVTRLVEFKNDYIQYIRTDYNANVRRRRIESASAQCGFVRLPCRAGLDAPDVFCATRVRAHRCATSHPSSPQTDAVASTPPVRHRDAAVELGVDAVRIPGVCTTRADSTPPAQRSQLGEHVALDPPPRVSGLAGRGLAAARDASRLEERVLRALDPRVSRASPRLMRAHAGSTPLARRSRLAAAQDASGERSARTRSLTAHHGRLHDPGSCALDSARAALPTRSVHPRSHTPALCANRLAALESD
ncbi:hypothetical protein B0H14DRAFT_3890859 [Mycena olivaceomarginata]|nr:hypothetical protein B0H14DRAFT_3890859 [Mycena olivaceomarginata]